jgi:hypothetical protein
MFDLIWYILIGLIAGMISKSVMHVQRLSTHGCPADAQIDFIAAIRESPDKALRGSSNQAFHSAALTTVLPSDS